MDRTNEVVLLLTILMAMVGLIDCRNLQLSLPTKDNAVEGANTPSGGAGDIDYEPGYVVETVLDGDNFNLSIFLTVPVPGQDYVYALDRTASQLLRLKVPIDPSDKEMYRIVVGDWKGTPGYRDGVGEKALLDKPRGLAVDDNGNIYVADVKNRVIRKITPTGYVSTIAGKRDVTGHADGKGRDALFSADFDLTYVPRTCSLYVNDRGSRRVRMIQLQCGPEKPNAGGGFYGMNLKGIVFGAVSTVSVLALWTVLSQTRQLQLHQYLPSFLAIGSSGATEPLIDLHSDTASETSEHLATTGQNSQQGFVPATDDGELARVVSMSYEGGQENHGDTAIMSVNDRLSPDDHQPVNPETTVNSLTYSFPGAASSSTAISSPTRIDMLEQKYLAEEKYLEAFRRDDK